MTTSADLLIDGFGRIRENVLDVLADLTPAPVMADKYMTILNEPQLTAYMAYFQASVLPATQAVLTADLGTPEARFFLRRYAGARRITLDYDGKPYYVLLRRT